MGRKAIDLTGQWFGRLEVVGRADAAGAGRAVWLCRCRCGGEANVMGHNLRTGRTVSCGCALADANKVRHIKARQPNGAPSRKHKPMGVLRKITFQGRTQGLQDWARELDVNYQLIQYRLDKGWSVGKALTTPSRKSLKLP
jgi:hypothetical protein